MKYKIKIPKKKNLSEIKIYFKKVGLGFILDYSNSNLSNNSHDLRYSKSVYPPNLQDLYSLHQLIILNKRIKILEYGTGWSTLVMSHALHLNNKKFRKINLPRFTNPFTMISLDNCKNYLNISKLRVKKYIRNLNTKFAFSNIRITKFNGKYATEYKSHPLINPDFIYVDGPDQLTKIFKIDNFTINHNDFMPMSCDILKYEHYLTPGTVIVFDGRNSNLRFFLNNTQRNWSVKEDKNLDQAILFLNEKPLGYWNNKQLRFYNL